MGKLFYYIYPNKTENYNVVADEHIENHIRYNLDFRPGRLMYAEDDETGYKRLNDGCLKDEVLPEYDRMAEEFFSKNKPDSLNAISRHHITAPYT